MGFFKTDREKIDAIRERERKAEDRSHLHFLKEQKRKAKEREEDWTGYPS